MNAQAPAIDTQTLLAAGGAKTLPDALLSQIDWIVAVDSSGSMEEASIVDPSIDRWTEMQEDVSRIANKASKFDEDGIDVVRYGNDSISVAEGVTGAKVKEVFAEWSPGGRTPTHLPVNFAVQKALKTGKPTILILATDGGADNEQLLIQAIGEGATKLGRPKTLNEDGTPVETIGKGIGFVFVQVGHDRTAEKLMSKLDSGLPFPDCLSVVRAEQLATMSLNTLGYLAFNG